MSRRAAWTSWPLALLAVAGWLAGSMRWERPGVWSEDAASYVLIAEAAPGLPGGGVGSAYAGRWIPHWLVGALGEASGLPLHACYWIAASLAVVAVLAVAALACQAVGVRRPVAMAALLAFSLSPYAGLRAALQAPGLIQDLVFVLGLGLTLVGLLRVRLLVVVVGVVLALAGRQSMLLVLPVVAAWIVLEPAWSAVGRRAARATLVVGVGGFGYTAVALVAARFDYPFGPDGLVDTLVLDRPGLGTVFTHLGRTAVPFLPLAVVGSTAAVLLVRRGRSSRPPARLVLLLALWAAVVIQPALISPDFPGFAYNEQRLAGLGLLPFALAVALLVDRAIDLDRVGVRAPAVGVLLIGSLSHTFTWFGPASLQQFLIAQVLCAVALGWLMWRVAHPLAGGTTTSRRPAQSIPEATSSA